MKILLCKTKEPTSDDVHFSHSYSKMTRTKNAARRGNFNKRTNIGSQKRKPEDGPPPSKKAKKNPPSSTSLKTVSTNTNQAQSSPADAPTTGQSNDVTPSEVPEVVGDFATTHDVTNMNITSGSHIQQKVIRALELLSVYPILPNEKPKVLMLHAKAHFASKMISIAEIAKREIAKKGGKWFQYNKVESLMVEQRERVRKGKEEKDAGEEKDVEEAEDGEAESEEETTAFETMKTPFERANEGNPKMRAVPVMTLYLSRVRIESLRKAYG